MFYYLNCFPIFREGSSPAHSHHGSSPIIDPWIKSRIEIKKLILAHFYKKTRNYIFDRLYYESVFFFLFSQFLYSICFDELNSVELQTPYKCKYNWVMLEANTS